MIFKTEAQLLASGWRWTGERVRRLDTNNPYDNSIPENMLDELSGRNVEIGFNGFWSVTPAMVTTETEIAKRIIESYE